MFSRPTQPPVQWVTVSFPGGNGAGREVDNLPASSAKIKNEWSYTPTGSICLRDVGRDN